MLDALSPGTQRLLAAALVLALYAALCLAVWRAQRRRQQRAAREAAALQPAGGGGAASVLVSFASQTGFAEQLAWQTARALHAAGVPARLLPLGQVTALDLAGAARALFIASSYGEGDPPDAATLFARRVMAAAPGAPPLALGGLHYALLALGDRSYAQFCGFGRRLDAWLSGQGARPLFERIEVDNADPAALTAWRHQLSHLAGTTDLPDWEAPAFSPWRLAVRQHLNPGSAGGPLFHLELEPPPGQPLPDWEAGDLVQVQAPADPGRPREYSIASIPADGRVHLLVRQERRADGSLGAASGWLTREAAIGGTVELRLRAHANFRAGPNAGRPLILLGNGTGLAGLRSHLKARAQARTPAHAPTNIPGGPAAAPPGWLVFGERQAAHDQPYRDEIDAWLAGGVLARADRVFSRDPAERRYVQHLLLDNAGELQRWVADGAAIYVCGSLQGMAQGVHDALAAALGADGLDQLAEAGRYRRDVY
jgi:sulfite reductase (NADPH) flavoprotein alpha-component